MLRKDFPEAIAELVHVGGRCVDNEISFTLHRFEEQWHKKIPM
jgi:hypothetical protein